MEELVCDIELRLQDTSELIWAHAKRLIPCKMVNVINMELYSIKKKVIQFIQSATPTAMFWFSEH